MRQEKDDKTNRTWGDDEATNRGLGIAMRSKSARFELLDTDYGIQIASRREADEDHIYWRINQFLFPYYTMPPSHRVVRVHRDAGSAANAHRCRGQSRQRPSPGCGLNSVILPCRRCHAEEEEGQGGEAEAFHGG